jgi:hypothetical protein
VTEKKQETSQKKPEVPKIVPKEVAVKKVEAVKI